MLLSHHTAISKLSLLSAITEQTLQDIMLVKGYPRWNVKQTRFDLGISMLGKAPSQNLC